MFNILFKRRKMSTGVQGVYVNETMRGGSDVCVGDAGPNGGVFVKGILLANILSTWSWEGGNAVYVLWGTECN